MRATVGLMLTHGNAEPAMSRPDYSQTALHHSCLLVLLCGSGSSKPRSLQKAFEKVKRVNNIRVNDSSGASRTIWIRYVYDYPVENNEWDNFQTHRRLLGLITIGKFDSQIELNELCRHHEVLKVRYGSTLYESRAIFFGPEMSNGETNSTLYHVDDNSLDKITPLEAIGEHSSNQIKRSTKRLEDEYTTPTNFKAKAFFYREHDPCLDLEEHISDFATDLFWILESKRLERAREKTDKVSLISVPFEKRETIGLLDKDSRSNRKRCLGRVTKNLADLSLQAGLVEDALNLYHNSYETLRSIGDTLWVGAIEEGLCSASAMLHYPHLRELETFHRNASLQEGNSLLRNIPDKWRSRDLTKKLTETLEPNAQQHAGQLTAASSCSSVSSILTANSSASGTPTTLSSSASTISTTPIGNQKQRSNGELPNNILKRDELPNYYRKAIINYSKFGSAAVIETEAGLKAARICIEQNRPLDVVMFLQNILHVNINLSEPERAKRFKVLTELYHQIGFRRKAAFFQRFAAIKHVQASPNPDWQQNYSLTLGSFSGYLLSLDPLEVLENAAGWPALQIELVQSLITAARRLGQSALATRHMTYLLQTQWSNMSPAKQSEMALQLQNLSAQCEGSPVPLVLENGTVIPPANLTDLPYCMKLAVKDLPAQLRPQRIKIAQTDSGPFLFTPIHFNSIDRREKKKDKNKIDFLWVQNDMCEVCLCLRNPLPLELTVSDMRLLTNGVVFESLPETVVLQSNVPTYITLIGKPIEVGQLDIQGYSTHTLGVKSNCRLKNMRERNFPPNYLVDVIPALPRINVKTSLPQMGTFNNTPHADIVVTTANVTLYNGESTSCTISITNQSTNLLPVEHLEISINSNVELEIQKKIFRIDESALQAKLPIAPQATIEIPVHIYADAEFVSIAGYQHSSIGNLQYSDYGTQSLPQFSSMSSADHASLPTRMSSPYHQQQQTTNRRNDLNYTSFRSSSTTTTTSLAGAAPNSVAALSSFPAADGAMSIGTQYVQNIEAQFRIKYSGGDAMASGYCRQCAISFQLELLPSALITNWDVLPAEISSQFYLVLDITNLTAQEMSLNYTDNKNILIEAKESCRVPIPVERCSLAQVYAAREAEIAENMEKELCFRTQILSFTDSIGKLCAEHIAEHVKVKWALTGTDIHGVASLRGIVLTASMIDLTTVSPLQWFVSFDGNSVEPHSELLCTAGKRSLLSITICNQSMQPLKNLLLTIKFYQDYNNGKQNYNLETRVTLSGPDILSIPILAQNEKMQHLCSVIFFTPGRFRINIQCYTKPQSTHLTRSCPESVSYARNQLNDLGIYGAGVATSNHEQEQQEHIWKFIPPIAVTVIEQ